MQCMTRAQAREAGEKFYLTGTPCKSGHVAPRYTAFGTCTECNKEQHKRWVAANKERAKEIQRASEAKALAETPDLVRAKKAERARVYRSKNKDRLRTERAAHYKANADVLRLYSRAWYAKNRQGQVARVTAWRAANPDVARKAASMRRAAKRIAMPAWFSDFDEFVLTEAYALASIRQSALGGQWDVDHLIPLQARHACGLHVGSNIAVIPRRLNMRKNNRLMFTEPGSWVGA